MEELDAVMAVDTPERVRFFHRVAGPGLRALAWLVDVVVMAALVTIGAVVSMLTFPLLQVGSVGLMLLAFFVLTWGYGAVFEALWQGQTPGKVAMGLRVVRADGGPVGPVEALLRNLLRGVDGLPVGYGVGALMTMCDPQLRRLGDIVAGTVVVVERSGALAAPITLTEPVSEAERHALPMRVVLTAGERRAIEGLLRRRERLGPARTEELAALLAPRVGERWGVQAPTQLRTLELAWAAATGAAS